MSDSVFTNSITTLVGINQGSSMYLNLDLSTKQTLVGIIRGILCVSEYGYLNLISTLVGIISGSSMYQNLDLTHNNNPGG